MLNPDTPSYSGALWRLPVSDPRLSLMLQQRYALVPAVADVIAGRNIPLSDIEGFLNPSLRSSLPDPLRFIDMDKAANRIARAIINQEQIAVFGDYDVDGATSAALWSRFLMMIGQQAMLYIPDRIEEGYGPNANALHKLQAQGASLVLTVDCGISAFEALESAHQAKLDVIVLDHHQASALLPPATGIVNPNRIDETCDGYGDLAAVGVCYLTIIAVNRMLRDQGYYQQHSLKSPDLLSLLDLVALGTVCDVVKLRGLNRVFVAQGLKIMAQRRNIGINALMDVAAIDSPPEAYHCGFVLGPRVNAGGRVGDSYLGAHLLSTHDPALAKENATKLDLYNLERKEIEQACLDDAINMLESRNDRAHKDWFIMVSDEAWHPGVIGIVAGRLKDRYYRPTIVIALDKNGIGKGSARSIDGVDIGAIITSARDLGLIMNGGGHKMAAGLSLTKEQIPEFETYLQDQIRSALNDISPIPVQRADGILDPRGVNLTLCDQLDQLAPFGAGNSEPRYILTPVRVTRARIVGQDHLSLNLSGIDGGNLQAISFRCVGTELGDQLQKAVGAPPISLLGRIKRNEWQGMVSVQFMVDDAAPL